MLEKIVADQENGSNRIYQLVQPDGGWGYLVAFAFVVYSILSSAQIESFGLLYGDFLLEVTGDKAYGISLANGIFFTCQCFAGFLVYILVHITTFQKVGFIGALLYCLGSVGSVFMTDMAQMILFVSIFQGAGLGLITNAMYSSIYSFFTKKKNIVMGISQTMVMIGIFVSPYVAEAVIVSIGFRKSLWVVTGFAGVVFITVGLLEPVEKHMKKELVNANTCNSETVDNTESLIYKKQEFQTSSLVINPGAKFRLADAKNSKDEKSGCFKMIEWSLLKSYIYWSVALGAGSVFFSDAAFVAVIPAVLSDIGYPSSDVAVMMTVYFGADLVGRLSYSLVNVFYKTRNRYIYFGGALVTVIFRIIFSSVTSYFWLSTVLGILGYVRGLLQITQTLNLVEEFKEKFPSAFSLMFALGGVYSFVLGLLASYVKLLTKSNVYMLHFLTAAVMTCVVLWSIEFIYRLYFSKNKLVDNINLQ